jgi:pseudoazurin
MKKLIKVGASLLMLASPLLGFADGDGFADESVFQTYTIHANVTSFVPSVLRINVGDKLAFENMATHNATEMPQYSPEGAEFFSGWLSPLGMDFVTPRFNKPGLYFIKCDPHYSMGMVMAVIVGDGEPENLAKIREMDIKGVDKRLLNHVESFLALEKTN